MLDPTQTTEHLNLAEQYINNNQCDAAIAVLHQLIAADSENLPAYELLSEAHYFKDENQLAILYANRAIAINSTSILSHVTLGFALLNIQAYVMAAEMMSQILLMFENNPHFQAPSEQRGLLLTIRGEAYKCMQLWDEAFSDLTQAIQFKEDNALAYKFRGEIHLAQYNYKQAVEDFTRALDVSEKKSNENSSSPDASITRADVLALRATAYNHFSNEQAIEDGRAAIAIDPNCLPAHRILATALELTDLQGAFHHANRCIELGGENHSHMSFAYSIRGSLYLRQSEFDLARQDFNNALICNPLSLIDYELLGQAYFFENNYREAALHFSQAVNMGARSSENFSWLAASEVGLGDYETAIQDADSAIKIDEKNIIAHFKKGEALLYLQQYEQSIPCFDTVLALDSNYAMAYHLRGDAHTFVGRLDAAIADLSIALQYMPDRGFVYLSRARAYKMAFHDDLALSDLNHAIQLMPHESDPYQLRAEIYLYKQQRDLAIIDAEKALTLAPHSSAAYRVKGLAHLLQSNYSAALNDFNAAIELGDPHQAVNYLYRGQTYLSLGEYAIAEQDLTTSIELNSFSHQTYLQRAELYEMMGKSELAAKDMMRAEQLKPR